MKKRIISFLLALVVVFGCLPVGALAAKNTETTYCALEPYGSNAKLVEVTKDGGAYLRSGPGEKYSIVTSCKENTVLEVNNTKINAYLNKWYQVSFRNADGTECYSGWIYSKNTASHKHAYEHLFYEDLRYNICNCGSVTVTVKKDIKLMRNGSVLVGVAAAGTAAAVDGPLPLGDAVGLGILITVGVMDALQVMPSADTVGELMEDIDFDEYLKTKQENSCPPGTYRAVERTKTGLRYSKIITRCLNIVDAYIIVRLGISDVYAQDMLDAELLASFAGENHFCEVHDSNSAFYYHYHIGEKTNGVHTNVRGKHIFFGSSLNGSTPSYT